MNVDRLQKEEILLENICVFSITLLSQQMNFMAPKPRFFCLSSASIGLGPTSKLRVNIYFLLHDACTDNDNSMLRLGTVL